MKACRMVSMQREIGVDAVVTKDRGMFPLKESVQALFFADECRKPGDDISRYVLIAAPPIALKYIHCRNGRPTGYTTPENIDVAAPVQQVIHAEFGNYGLGTALSTVAVLALSIALIASGSSTSGLWHVCRWLPIGTDYCRAGRASCTPRFARLLKRSVRYLEA
jgi:hypothetical protein